MSASNANYAGLLLPLSGAATNWIGNGQTSSYTTGTAKNDAIYGTGAAWTFAGGAGDDTYYVYGQEKIVEAAGQGIDTVVSAYTNVTLSANVENLSMSGAFAGIGNDLANVMSGDQAAQTLNGGAGDDVLTGGGGADLFVFDANSGNDVITDFKPGSGASIRLAGYTQFSTLAQVQAAMTQVGADTVLKLDATDSITFRNVQKAAFGSGDFKLAINTSAMHPTFTEDFNSLNLWSSSKGGTWRTDFGYGLTSDSVGSRTEPANGELEIYVDPTMKGQGTTPVGINPFSINNGVLTITAAPTPAALKQALYGYQYTSGLLTTENSFAQEYGYFEVRAQLPAGPGAWPTFWLLPAAGGWPPELDVMESWGSNSVNQTSHTGSGNSQSVTTTTVAGATTGFHTYGMLWDADHITWYVDGVMTGEIATPADMHQKMYMLLNLAIAPGTSATVLPAQLQVDYVHVYSLPDASAAPVTTPTAPVQSVPTTTATSSPTTPVATSTPTTTVSAAPPTASATSGSSSTTPVADTSLPSAPTSSSTVSTTSLTTGGASAQQAASTDGAGTSSGTSTTVTTSTAVADSQHVVSVAPSSNVSSTHAVDATSAAATLSVELQNLTRSTTVPTASTLAAHGLSDLAAAATLIGQVAAGTADAASAEAKLMDAVTGTISVANVSYDFFTGATPTEKGLAYLVNSDANPNDLSDSYYAAFNVQNRFINFAVSLGTGNGAGASAFSAAYGAGSLSDATTKLYQAIFGVAPVAGKVAQILSDAVPDGHGGTETRAAYLATVANSTPDGVAAKAAVAGWLLGESLTEKVGPYYDAESHFVQALAHGTATFNLDLLSGYAAGASLVGAPQLDPALVH